MVVTCVGMVSAVGRDFRHSCASIRAGLSRPVELEYFDSLNDESQSLEPVSAHRVSALTEGFFLTSAWLRLAVASLQDVFAQGFLVETGDAEIWERTAIIAVTPSAHADRYGLETEEVTPIEYQDFLVKAVRRLQLPFQADNMSVVAGQKQGLVLALLKSEDLLHSGQIDRVLVCAVDSYLDMETLSWLDEAGRLKSVAAPTGLAPGEAAVSLLLENEDSASSRGLRPIARFGGFSVSSINLEAADTRGDPDGTESDATVDEQSLGNANGAAIMQTLRNVNFEVPFDGDIVCDLNGEEIRARRVFGAVSVNALVGDSFRLVTPAESVGDVGQAAPAVCAAYAIWMGLRGYNSSAGTMVVSCSDGGQFGSFALLREDRSN